MVTPMYIYIILDLNYRVKGYLHVYIYIYIHTYTYVRSGSLGNSMMIASKYIKTYNLHQNEKNKSTKDNYSTFIV